MDEEILKNIDILTINYISLKGLTNEVLGKENPIFNYYVSKMINQFYDSNNVFNDISNQLGTHNIDIDEIINRAFVNNYVTMSDELLQKIIEYSYPMYVELDKLNINIDPKVLPLLTEILGEQVDYNKIITNIKKEFKSSFLYIIGHTNYNNEKYIHIKIKILTNKLKNAVDSENYMDAAKIREEIKKTKNNE